MPSKNLTSPLLNITNHDREALLKQKGKIIWFTGLSGAGKSTLANALEVALHQQGKYTFFLDGDIVRQGLNQDLGFSNEDRIENIRRIAHIAKLMLDAGLIVICAFISPFQRERDLARGLAGDDRFIEIYLNTSLETCAQRDTKGLYQKASAGTLNNLSGIGSDYQAPTHPEITLNTAEYSIPQSIEKILTYIQ